MINLRQAAVAGTSLPPIAREAVRKARYVLAAFVVDAMRLYRLGGILGILLGVFASIVAAQTRRVGR